MTKTSLYLDQEALQELKELTHQSTSEIVNNAIRKMLKEIKRNNIKNSFGKLDVDDTYRQLRKIELNG